MTARCEQKDAARIERRYERQATRRCFWRWPLGHCLHWQLDEHLVKIGRCCCCPKVSISIPRIGPRRR